MLKYKKRIRKIVKGFGVYINSKGEHISQPKAIDIISDNGQLCYKSTSGACSCWMCSGHAKYKRHEQKVTNRKILEEALR